MKSTSHRWLAATGDVQAPGGRARSVRRCVDCGVRECRGFRAREGEGQWGGKTGRVKLWLTADGREKRTRPDCTADAERWQGSPHKYP